MKVYAFVLFLFIVPFEGISQQKYTLNDCKSLAKDNYPKLQQAELFESISQLRNKNTQSNYLPQIGLKGQATYQSEVTSIDLPETLTEMGFNLDPVSKDQYKVYLDIKQNIWDGGVTNAQTDLEQASLETNLQKLEIEAQQLNSIVEGYFFNILLMDKSINVLLNQQSVLSKQVEILQKAVSIGAVREKDKMKLEVEQLLLSQKVDEMRSRKKSLIEMLGVLTGKTFGNEDTFELPDVTADLKNENQRPEIKLFELQQKQLNYGDQLISSLRNPKFFGFGQAGYGKPGLNMLRNEFTPYYIFGIGLNWEVIDWKTSKRNKEINARNREMVALLKEDFIQKQQIQLVEAAEKIEDLKTQLQKDEKLVQMRKSIAESGASELGNGTITSTDYLIDLNAETTARINYEIHKIQLTQAKVNYNTLLGY